MVFPTPVFAVHTGQREIWKRVNSYSLVGWRALALLCLVGVRFFFFFWTAESVSVALVTYSFEFELWPRLTSAGNPVRAPSQLRSVTACSSSSFVSLRDVFLVSRFVQILN